MQETWVWSLGQEDPLEKGIAIYLLQYSYLEKNPMDREAWQAISPWSHKESDSTNTFTFFYFLVAAYTPGPIPL